MTNEWRDLPTLPDVAAALTAGDEIQLRFNGAWVEWLGTSWRKDSLYRARPRKPATKTIVLRRALVRNDAYDSESVLTTPDDISTDKRFICWLPGEETYEVEE